jgi:hypothetical protein
VILFLIGLIVASLAAEGVSRFAVARADAPVLRWHDFSSQLKIAQIADLASEPNVGAEVVIVGTSMAQQDLVPQLISAELGDVPVYNAGLNGGVPIVMEPWLNGQVVPMLSPSTVVWGLSPLDLSAVYGDATKNAYDQALETRPGILAEVDRRVSQFSTLVSSRAVLRDPSKLFGDEAEVRLGQAAQAAAGLGDAGERIFFDLDLGVDRQNEINGRVSPFSLDRDDLAAIARTIKKLRSQGIEVVLVELPVPARFVSLMPNTEQDHKLFADAVAALGAELNVTVLKPNETFSDDDFVDFTHLTSEAAGRLSSDVGSQLAAL